MTKLSFCNCGNETGVLELAQENAHVNQDQGQKMENNFLRNLKNYLLEYCREGSLHGVKYLGQRRTLVEKVWWGISMVVSLYLCVTLVLSAYEKWENSPVIVSFATRETPIWQIPFPAVTICPETKALPKKYNITHYLDMKINNLPLSKEEEDKFGYTSLICYYGGKLNYTSIEDKLSDEHEVLDFFDKVQPDFYKTMSECKFMGVERNCSELFFPIVTDEGMCYTFNLLDRSELFRDNVVHFKNYHKANSLSNWSVEHGYKLSDAKDTYPRRALFAGAIFALEAKVTVYDDEMVYSCGSSIQGFKIQLSHPSRMPRPKQQHFRIPLDTAIIAAIVPDITRTSEAVKNYNPKKRNCYFPNERPLKYFKIYTQQNCQIECKTNYTIEKCGCTNFYMPRDNTTKMCTGGRLGCIYQKEKDLLHSAIDIKLESMRKGTKNKNTDTCDCLPICTSMNYILENSESNWDWKRHYDSDDNTKHMSYFQIFFKGNQFITMERNELFGMTDFLANFGGLLGLFIGFSLLSLIEVLYYASLRIICNIKLFGARNWSGSDDLK